MGTPWPFPPRPLSNPQGKRLDRAFSLALQPRRFLGASGSLDTLMRTRHLGIDYLLEQAIESGKVSQVIELAAGLSGRGWRMAKQYADRLTYIETDLPAMAAVKREMLATAGLLSNQHRVVDVDALLDEGPLSLAALCKTLDPDQGLAIVTEGLLSYLNPTTAKALWLRISGQLQGFKHGLYISDGYIQSEVQSLSSTLIRSVLQPFVRGRLHNHYDSAKDAQEKLKAHGFTQATLHAARDLPATAKLGVTKPGRRVRILEAWAD